MMYQEARAKMEDLERQAAKAEGAVASLLEDLQTHFKCDSLEAAEALLKKLEKQHRTLTDECRDDLSAFEQEFGDKLNQEPT